MIVLVALIVVLVLITTATLIGRMAQKKKTPPVDPKKALKELEEFRMRARKITVNFSECEVLSNNYTTEVLQSHNYRVQALDSLYGDGGSNVSRVAVNQSVVVFKTMMGVKEMKYTSPVLAMDRTTLLFKLDFQKQTTLYVDPSDATHYYFDLTFLSRKS